jgi:hypothetical protein
MAKTYVPSLRFLAAGVHKYATRYQSQLSGSLTGPQYTALLAFIACCADLLAALGPAPIDN